MGLLDRIKKDTGKKVVVDKLETISDKIVAEVVNGPRELDRIAISIGEKKEVVEKWVRVLVLQNVLEITYPVNILHPPLVQVRDVKREERRRLAIDSKAKKVQQYDITADQVTAKITIWNSPKEIVPIYEISLPEIDVGTQAMLNNFVEELAEDVAVVMEEITDPEKVAEQKQKFFDITKEKIKASLSMDEGTTNTIAGILLHRMYGLGELDIILADDLLEEMVINGSHQPMSMFHKKQGWCKSVIYPKNEEDIYNFSAQIGRKVNREINSLNPIMDAHLITGDRVASTLFPISSRGNTITIRRFSRNPWTIISLIAEGGLSKEMGAFLWLAMQYELNILVAGGTASGKTSMLNSLCSFIPPNQRVLTIEDTRELMLPTDLHWNWVPLTSRNKNAEGQGEVTMLDLMVAALRMRPDRIVVGEVRRKEQAEVMFEAMHTGHSVYATLHADTAQQVKRRLIEPPISVPQAEVEALHLILIQYRDRRRGFRRALELVEVIGAEGELELNPLFRWRPRTDTFEQENESRRIYEDLNLHTGMTVKEIDDDLKMKAKILQWLIDHEVHDPDVVGGMMQLYYKDASIIEDAMKQNKKPTTVLGR